MYHECICLNFTHTNQLILKMTLLAEEGIAQVAPEAGDQLLVSSRTSIYTTGEAYNMGIVHSHMCEF